MEMAKTKHLITRILVCAIALLACISVRANTADSAPMEDVSIILDMPDVMFTCQRWSYIRLIIENKGAKPRRFWKNAVKVFARGWLHLEIENIQGNALGGAGSSGVLHLNKWVKGEYDVIEPGEILDIVYLVDDMILSPLKTGASKVRLQVRDSDTGEMVTFNEEIVKVRKLEDAEREVVAEEGRLSIERVTADNENTELIMLSPGNEYRLMHLLGIPPESKIELVGGKTTVHILATSSSGKQFYRRIAGGIDVLGSEEYNDGKKRTLKKQPDGSVTLEVVGGDDESAEESDESEPNIETNTTVDTDSTDPETLSKTNNDASIFKSGTNIPRPQKSQPATSKKTAPEAARSPFTVAIIAGLAVLFLGIALFIARRLSSRNSS